MRSSSLTLTSPRKRGEGKWMMRICLFTPSLSLPRKGKGTQPDTYVYYICAQLFKSELARK